jgi:hypothetical protein
VANLGPIAVDLLAIMATALILSGRAVGQRDSGTDAERVRDSLTAREDKLAALSGRGLSTDVPGRDKPLSHVTEADTYTTAEMMSWTARDTGHVPTDIVSTVPLDTDTGQDIDVPLTVPDVDNWMSRLSRDMDTDTVPAAPVSAPSAVQGHGTRAVRPAVPDALDTDVLDMLSRGVPVPEIKRTLADKHGVSTKTVGRRFPKPAEEA